MRREESPLWSAGFTREWWAGLDKDKRQAFIDGLDDEQLEAFSRDWRIWARDKQLLPDDPEWDTCLMVTGRFFGKTRTAVEFLLDKVENEAPGVIAIVGQGEADIRNVMINGVSGFIACSPSWNKPKFWPSVGGGTLIWPNNWVGQVYSAVDTESLRGPAFHYGWFDEPMAVPPEQRERAYDNLEFCLREGEHPQLIVTTTPKPHRWLQKLLADGTDPANRMLVIRGATSENTDGPQSFQNKVARKYQGSRTGDQELEGILLAAEEGALWTDDDLNRLRFADRDPLEVADFCDKIIVAVDPNTKGKDKKKASSTAHEAGVVVVGKRGGERFILGDYSTSGGPAKWGLAAIKAALDFDATEIYAEGNQGGEMVREVINLIAQREGADICKVIIGWSSKSKIRRAEPASQLYGKKVVHHVGPADQYKKLELQMCSVHEDYDPTGEDFDRLDALVHGLTRLGLKAKGGGASAGVSAGGGFFAFDDIGR